MRRYIRQEALAQIGPGGQGLLRKSSVAIVGAGAIGTVAGELLVRAGIGKLLIVDGDVIDLVNLHRQFMFSENDVGKKKAVTLKSKLEEINSAVKIEALSKFIDEKNIDILSNYNLILDCTDNMRARHMINDYCERTGKPWIYAAAVGVDANVLFVNDPGKFRKYFKLSDSFDECSRIGIINSASAMAATLQVTEAVKFLVGKRPCKELIRFNLWKNEYRKIRLGSYKNKKISP